MKSAKELRRPGAHRLRIGRCSEKNRIYHVVTSTADREPYFSNLLVGRLVVNAMRREDEASHTTTLAFVVMPDHLHWLFSLNGSRSLSDTTGIMKSWSTRQINSFLGRRGRIWRPGFYDHAIRVDDVLVRVARYIIANPLRAKLVTSVRHYSLWDSVWINVSRAGARSYSAANVKVLRRYFR